MIKSCYLSLFRRLRARGYRIHLFYLWVPNVQLAIQRVRDRVRHGGHSVPEEDIRRRFNRGVKNLFSEYMPLLDGWTLLDNSGGHPKLIAHARENHVYMGNANLFHKIEEDIE